MRDSVYGEDKRELPTKGKSGRKTFNAQIKWNLSLYSGTALKHNVSLYCGTDEV